EIIGWNVARILGFARRYEEAVEHLRALDRLYPGSTRVVPSLGMYLMALGRNAEAGETMEPLAVPRMQTRTGKAQRLRTLLDGVRAGRAESLVALFLEMMPQRNDAHARMFTAYTLAASGQM